MIKVPVLSGGDIHNDTEMDRVVAILYGTLSRVGARVGGKNHRVEMISRKYFKEIRRAAHPSSASAASDTTSSLRSHSSLILPQGLAVQNVPSRRTFSLRRKANILKPLSTNELYVVESDSRTRDALSAAFALAGYHVVVFREAKTFIAAARVKAPAGVVLGFHLPDQSGLVVLDELDAKQYPAPILMISADDNIACAVKAVKNGAFDYLVKPIEAAQVVESVANAIEVFGKGRGASDARHAKLDFPGAALLTARERAVLSEISGGATNREAGRRLCISARTVEAHRARAMEKIGAKNATHMMRIVLGAGAFAL